MATHSSVLAWRIPGTEEPGGLPSMGSHKTEVTEQQKRQQPKKPKSLKLKAACSQPVHQEENSLSRYTDQSL